MARRPPSPDGGAIDRAAVVSAVERYLASRGIAVSAPAASTAGRGPVVRMFHAGAAAIRRPAVRGGERRRRSGGPLSGPPRHSAGRSQSGSQKSGGYS